MRKHAAAALCLAWTLRGPASATVVPVRPSQVQTQLAAPTAEVGGTAGSATPDFALQPPALGVESLALPSIAAPGQLGVERELARLLERPIDEAARDLVARAESPENASARVAMALLADPGRAAAPAPPGAAPRPQALASALSEQGLASVREAVDRLERTAPEAMVALKAGAARLKAAELDAMSRWLFDGAAASAAADTQVPAVPASAPSAPRRMAGLAPSGEEIPVPLQPPVLDDAKASAWEERSRGDPEMAAVKRTVLDNRTHVGFAEFLAALKEAVGKANPLLGKEPYGVLWDYKNHSSRRWAYSLAEKDLAVKPAAVSYFQGRMEPRTNALRRMAEQGLQTFVIVDDAIYSGDQAWNGSIARVQELYAQWGRPEPKFIVIAPFVTSRTLRLLNGKPGVTLVHSRLMRSIEEILSPAEHRVLEERGGKFDPDDEEPALLSAVVTSFDHRLADENSFLKNVAHLFNPFERPYARPGTAYYQREEEEFARYLNPPAAAP